MDSDSLVIMLAVICIVFYFAPAFNASSRKHPSTAPIFLLNLLLGWTLVGWVVALVWSASAIGPVEQIRVKSDEIPGPDKYQKLETLGSLKERGLISDDEYQAEKTKLLNS
jgi:hypothetical protein